MTSPGPEHPAPQYPPTQAYPHVAMPSAPIRPKKKSPLPIILGVVGGFALLFCGGSVLAVALGGSPKPAADVTQAREESATQAPPATKARATDAAQAEPKMARMNQPVRDGKFEFVVTKVKCGVSKVGESFLAKNAQGQYCLVTTTVKNIGKEPQMLSDSGQKAFDANGAEYATDEAGLYANKNGEVFLNNINPGNKVTAILVWDIPKGAKLTKVELHDSVFSGGVEVSLN